MRRPVMDRGFRRIKKAPAAEPVDPRLMLVDLFMGREVQPEGFVDLSSGPKGEHYSDLFIEDAQEPAEQPAADETENLAVEEPQAADEAQVKPEQVSEPEDLEPVAEEDDYDPIAAVLG